MDFVVIACGDCGQAVRIRQPAEICRSFCPRCGAELCLGAKRTVDRPLITALIMGALAAGLMLIAFIWALLPHDSSAPRPADAAGSRIALDSSASPPIADDLRPELPAEPPQPAPKSAEKTTERVLPAPAGAVLIRHVSARRGEGGGPPRSGLESDAGQEPEGPLSGRFRVKDENGRSVVARLHGRWADKTVLILPDGQLGIPNMLIPTVEPFQPLTADELLPRLQQGPLGDFQVLRTSHYLIFYKSSQSFADGSGKLLEDLYRRLLDAFRKNQVPVHEAEFPLVAVIYRSEREFRASHTVEPVVQAFYEIYTNRIIFFEISDQDQSSPEISALRKPQTVAHEGTHQILQNIGVHPRLSSWPIWLVEGLAEYCASPCMARKGGKPLWDGLGMINGLHMATIRELDDPLSLKVVGDGPPVKPIVREPGKSLVETLVRKTRLTPTEYSLAWAMTHYLAFKKQDDFLSYLKTMSELAPLEPRSPEEHLAEFEKAFGSDLFKLDRAIDAYLRKLDSQKKFDRMPFYAVMYEQVIPTGLVRRARVSQSPQVIWQWVQEVTLPQGAQPTWQAVPHDTRARAVHAVEVWMNGSG